MAIEVGGNQKAPQGMCPHCKKIVYLNLDPWKEDATRIMESKCPFCGGSMFTGLLIVMDPTLPGLAQAIQAIIEVVKPGMSKYAGE